MLKQSGPFARRGVASTRGKRIWSVPGAALCTVSARSPCISVKKPICFCAQALLFFLLQRRLRRQFSSWPNANKPQKSAWPHTVALRHYGDLLATAAKAPRGEVPRHAGLNQTWFTITYMWAGWAQMVTAEHSRRWLCSVSYSVTSIFFAGPAPGQSEFCWLEWQMCKPVWGNSHGLAPLVSEQEQHGYLLFY